MPLWILPLAAGVTALPAHVEAHSAVPDDAILVTARRRAESIVAVPVAVRAFDGENVDRLPIRDVQDLQRYVPELQTSQVTRDETIIVMRGQGPGVGAFPGVLTYFNEVPFRGSGEGFYYDLSSIQVLKGPQGTLFGRNANGGAILFGSAAPTGEVGGYVEGELGDDANRQVQGALNLPLAGENLAVRVAGTAGSRDGFTMLADGSGRLDDRNFAGGRVSLRWQPDVAIRNDLIADFTRVDTHGTSAILLALNPAGPLALLPPQASGAALALLAQQKLLGARVQAGVSTDPRRLAKQWGVSDRLEIDLSPNLTLTNILAYRRYELLFRADYDGLPLPFLDFSITPDGRNVDDEQITEELQLKGVTGKVHYTMGAFYQHNRPAGEQRQIGVIYFQPLLQVNDADDLSRAVYGQIQYDAGALVPRLELSAGGRLTWDRRRQTAATVNLASGVCSNPDTTPPACLATDTARFSAPSWSMTAAWTPQAGTLVYLTSRRGYKSGGLNLGQPFAAVRRYAPEYLTDVELGLKTSAALGATTLGINAAAYRGWYRNVQVNALVPDPQRGAIYNIVENGATATLQGIELSGTLTTPAGIQVSAFYAYTDAQYDRYLSSIYGDLSGAPWPYTARHRASVNASWRLPVPERIGRPMLSANASLQSKSTFGYDPDPETREPGRAVIDAAFDWEAVFGSSIDAGVYVTNLTNKLYRTGVIGLYNTLGLSSAVYGAPRMFGARVRVAFGGEAAK